MLGKLSTNNLPISLRVGPDRCGSDAVSHAGCEKVVLFHFAILRALYIKTEHCHEPYSVFNF